MPGTEEAQSRHPQFRALYRAEFAFVWAVARRFGVPPAALDDAVQEVFLTAFRRLDALRYEVSLRAWLYTVTRKVASHHHRGRARLARRVAALATLTSDTNETPHTRHEAAQQLEQLLARLPRATRSVWELTELLGMSGPEIAAELELPLNTVYSRLRLARAQLSTLSAETLAACVATARRDAAPPEQAAQRNWALMLPLLGPGKLGLTASAWATSHPALTMTLVASAAAVVLTLAPRTDPAPIAPPIPDPPITRDQRPSATRIEPTLEPSPPPAPTTPSSPKDRLAAELALIDRAHRHLLAGESTAALALLAQHTREFPDGTLQDAREAARIEALCQRGARAEAEATASRLFILFPESLIARRFEHYVCSP